MPSLAAKMIGIGFDGLSPTPELKALIARGVRHVILFSRNVQSPDQVFDLCREVKSLSPDPIAICIDQEGGRVRRLRDGFTDVPAMRELGATGDAALARDIGNILGTELRAVNIDVDFAPVLDVDSNPANPVIASRSIGNAADVVSRLGVALIEGIQSAGVAACAKHFPGHGDTSQDSHLMLPRLAHTLERLQSVELPPFAAAIRAGVASIMTAHVIFEPIDNERPATMSPPVLNGILRKQLGYDGVVFSDDMEMKAIAAHFGVEPSIVRCVAAGVDVPIICHNPALQNKAIDLIEAAVASGELPAGRLEESSRRIDTMHAKYVRPSPAKFDASKLATPEHAAVVDRVRRFIATAVDPTEAWRANTPKS